MSQGKNPQRPFEILEKPAHSIEIKNMTTKQTAAAIAIAAAVIIAGWILWPKVAAKADPTILPSENKPMAMGIELRPELRPVCSCESTGRPDQKPRHYGRDG